MDAISILTASGMQARMQSLEMLANNLANVETGGYKADREQFSLYMGPDSAPNPVNGASTTLPLIERHWTDNAQGALRQTSNPLDLGIEGAGMFAVQTPQGVRYTRNGNFRLSPTGALAAADGSPVRSSTGGSLNLRPGSPADIGPDGTVTQGGQTVGRIEVVEFAAGAVEKAGSNYFVPADGATPKPATGTVVQGKLEQSNVGSAESAVRLVAILRQFEMLQKAMTIGNELNRKAIEEVAKVAA